MKIKFKGEEGLDQGGVQKEFFQLIFNDLLDPASDLFTFDPDTRLSWLNSKSTEDLRMFLIFGAILGLALYNGVMINANFPLIFYRKLLYDFDNEDSGHLITIDDLAQLQPQTYKGLCLLLNWKSENGAVEDIFVRTFEIAFDDGDGRHGQDVETIPLVKGGENIFVTESNRDDYVDKYVNYLLKTRVDRVFKPLREGFWRVIGGPEYLKMSLESSSASESSSSVISQGQQAKKGAGSIAAKQKVPCALELFRPEELQVLLTGQCSATKSLIYTADAFQELKNVTRYDEYTEQSPTIINFWSIVLENFTDDQRRKLLWFVTASDRIPLGGLKDVQFVIQRNGRHSDRLPTSMTCFGRLLLPEYESIDRMQYLLSVAIEESQGFGLI
jgi:ubiquitin-protein ligase E3 A